MSSGTTAIVLAAGKGTRMRSPRPKVLQPLCGRPMLAWVLDQARALEPERIVLVVGAGADEVAEAAHGMVGDRPLAVAVQEPQRGTGHAVQVAAAEGLVGERVVVLYGDMPLLRPETLEALVAAQRAAGPGAMAITTALPTEPRGFGRIVREDGAVRRVVEERDASPEETAIREVNVGVYCFDRAALGADLPRLSDANAQGELYLTDLVELGLDGGRPVASVRLEDPDEGLGVNTLHHLAEVRARLQERIQEVHLGAGVLIEDPASTVIDHGVEIGAGTAILPFSVIRSGVRIGAGCEVGPFTHLRTGTVLADGAVVGNFTEFKNSTVGERSKVKHLSYLGDTRLGARTNVGAGTIFANYDGRAKHVTEVGDGVFLGSGTIVVAPNAVPDGASTGAGAVVTRGAGMGPGDTFVGVPARRLAPRRPIVSGEEGVESEREEE